MTNTQTNRPDLIAYTVRESAEKSHWSRIGAAWRHQDGEGFNIRLEVLPLDGEIVLRTPKPSEDASQ